MQRIYLATYGTLRKGFDNWQKYLVNALYLKTCQASGFEMYHNRLIPYAFETQDLSKRIVIEVFEIDLQMLIACDELEGYPRHYHRKQIPIEENLMPWIYYAGEEAPVKESLEGPLASGDWKEWTQNSRAFGSNGF